MISAPLSSPLYTRSLIIPEQNYCLWCHKQQYKASVPQLFCIEIFYILLKYFSPFLSEIFFFINSVYFRRMTGMMIPSEMPVLSQPRPAENGHSSVSFPPDSQNVFQNPDLFRSGLFSQLGSDQMQILQNLQQISGQRERQKEVRDECSSPSWRFSPKYSVPTSPSTSLLLSWADPVCFCLVKTSQLAGDTKTTTSPVPVL